MTAKFNADILGRLAEATAEEITAALAAIAEDAQSFHGAAPTQATADAVNALKEGAVALRAELSSRAALASQQSEALASLADLTAEPAPTEPAPVVEALADTTTADDEDKPETVDAPEVGAENEGDEPVVTADARRRLGSNNRGPATTRAALPQVHFRTTASAGLADHAAGAPLAREDLYRAFHSKLLAANANTPGTERYTVATMRAQFPEQRALRAGASAIENMVKIEAAVDQARGIQATENALVAAGLCAPLETLYDIRVVGDTDRPVRDALVRFGVDRGGIQFRPAIDGVSQTGGIGVWTPANDEADPLVPKTCVEIACPGLQEAEIEAIYQCLTFSNMSTRFDPEHMDAVLKAQDIAYARFAENRLLTQLTTGSKAIYTTQLLGATRDTLVALDHTVAYYRNLHRLANDTPLRWIAPLWGKFMMRADITRQMVGDGLQSLAVTDAMINSWLAERNVNVTWHLDGINPADLTVPTPDVVVPAQFYTNLVAESPVPGFPDAMSTLLFAEGDWLHLDGGTLDLGVVRDSTLNGLNRFQTFEESFEKPVFRGIETLQLVIAANPTGASAATVSTAGAVD